MELLEPAVGTNDAVTLAQSQSQGGGGSPTRKFFDFPSTLNGTEFTASIAGSAAAMTAVAGEPNRPGILTHTTGTATNGRAGFSTGTTAFRASSNSTYLFEMSVRIPILSNSVERFRYNAGLVNQVAVDPTTGAWFVYDEGGTSAGGSVASPNWVIATARAGVKATTVTTVPVVAGSWYKLAITSTLDAATFSINDAVVGTHTNAVNNNSLPSDVAANAFGAAATMLKALGNTARLIHVDYLTYDYTITR